MYVTKTDLELGNKKLVLTEDLKAEWDRRNYNTLFCPASPLYM